MPTAAMVARALRVAAIVTVGVVAATIVVAVLEEQLGLPDASATYLVAVVVSAMLAGTVAGLGTAIASVLTYDLLFTEPTFTLHITDTGEWLSLLLLSFVAITVGQLVAIQRRRTAEALTREREAQDFYAVSRALATRTSTEAALGIIAAILSHRAGLDRVWFGAGASASQERIVADSGSGPTRPATSYVQLKRRADGTPSGWLAIHVPGQPRATATGKLRLRVVIEAAGTAIGSLWSERERTAPPLDPSADRLLAASADQIGQAWAQDRLAARAAEVRIARASDELKSALIESVSHDLRIPLAAIRAQAGPLIDPALRPGPEGVHDAALAIDQEAARLDRLVANLLDLGRIQGGMLEVHLEAVELREAVELAISRLSERVGVPRASIEVTLEEGWVDADPLLLRQALSNILENAIRHTPAGTRVLVTSSPSHDGLIGLSVEDSGPGVAAEALPLLFERFYRGASPGSARRPGSGIGLAVARGFVEAMGGRISARRSDLGGLAIDVHLPATVMPADLVSER